MLLKELNAILTALETAHREARDNSNTPNETARNFIMAVGPDKASQCMAAMIRRASWDGRISRTAKEWAASVALSEEWERRIDDAYCEAIHMAHLSQIAEAMPKELEYVSALEQSAGEAVAEEAAEEVSETVTITVPPEDAKLILRAINARVNHWRKPEQVNHFENASRIRAMYQDVSEAVTKQLTEQGVKI